MRSHCPKEKYINLYFYMNYTDLPQYPMEPQIFQKSSLHPGLVGNLLIHVQISVGIVGTSTVLLRQYKSKLSTSAWMIIRKKSSNQSNCPRILMAN